MPNKVWVGLLGGFGLSMLTVLISTLLGSELYAMVLVFIGISQLVLLTPALVFSRMRGKQELFKGLLIAGGMVFILNAACFGLVANMDLGFG